MRMADTKYLAIYHAAAWCPFCEQCTPDVTQWYADLRAGGDKSIEVVLLSADKSPAEFRKHLQDKKMTWLAVPMDAAKRASVRSVNPARLGRPVSGSRLDNSCSRRSVSRCAVTS